MNDHTGLTTWVVFDKKCFFLLSPLSPIVQLSGGGPGQLGILVLFESSSPIVEVSGGVWDGPEFIGPHLDRRWHTNTNLLFGDAKSQKSIFFGMYTDG